MAVDNDPSFSMGNVLKAGLAVLAAEGLYLWAFDNDDKDDSPVNVPTTAKPTEVKLADDAVTVTAVRQEYESFSLGTSEQQHTHAFKALTSIFSTYAFTLAVDKDSSPGLISSLPYIL